MWIIKHRRIFLSISAALVVLSIAALAIWGLRLGIDFKGGSLLEARFLAGRPDKSVLAEALGPLDLGTVTIQPIGEDSVLIRAKDIDEQKHQEVLKALKEKAPEQKLEEESFESIGPAIGQELKKRALWAIALVLIMIVLYIAYAFRKVSRLVSSWRYGVAALIALAHDVIIPTGIFAILGHFLGKEADLLFVTALLTILGFSVHDTIVVFDRIRENLRRGAGRDFQETVGLSVAQTLTRSISTSFTVLLTLLAIYFFGGASIKDFSLILILGIFFGTYSSIFIASPILVEWEKWRRGK